MALELKQSIKMSQRLIMTPQLQQAIKLLQLSRLELSQTINQEMEINPLLEEVSGDDVEEKLQEEEKKEESIKDNDPPLPEVTIKETIREDIDWEAYISEYNTAWASSSKESSEDRPSFENLISSKTNLYSHLMWQLQVTDLDEVQREVGRYIIGNIDPNGYLKTSIDNIIKFTHRSKKEVLKMLDIIQEFDPVGVGARDNRECLLIQLRFQGLGGSIAEKILINHMKQLERKRYNQIAKSVNVSIEEVLNAVSCIASLDPKPGRFYNDEETIYVIPDVYVYKVGDEFLIVLNEDGLPKLRISSFYKEALAMKDDISRDTREYIRDKLRSASWLIKSIHQRQRTIYKVSESILKFQRDFFEFGPSHLRPMILRDVSEDINMHESTVSRVMNNKYMYTPFGILVLKYFLNSTVQSVDGVDKIGSLSVKEMLKKIIREENKSKPFSDQEIARILERSNIDIARRTVAKYREMLRILPSNQRKNTYS
ncbi:MAG: RNA polymerase sigma-54 factor [Deltaproteobacteria bacterium]|nr:MAG: RNA polymerase sigma-54 factor [Deltaproteobacteria bacterium]